LFTTGETLEVNRRMSLSQPKKKVSRSLFEFIFFFFIAANQEMLKPNWDESVEKFDDLSLKEEVLRGIYGYGFVKPSPIQQKGILPVIQGKDTIAQA